LNTYFASWLDNSVPFATANTIHNNVIANDTNGGVDINSALIIKDIPLTSVKNIQSLVLYSRTGFSVSRVEGLGIELYNSTNDSNLETPLSSTKEISSVDKLVYRFDFPAIGTYSGGFSDTDSTTQIASETLALKEVVSEFAESANITGGLKVDTITTTGNVNVGGLVFEPNRPSFVAYSENFYTQSTAGENIKYDATLFDTTSSYNTSTFVYTIPVTGIYFFYYSFYWIAGTSAKVRLDKNGGQVDRVILSVITNNNNNFYGFAGGFRFRLVISRKQRAHK